METEEEEEEEEEEEQDRGGHTPDHGVQGRAGSSARWGEGKTVDEPTPIL